MEYRDRGEGGTKEKDVSAAIEGVSLEGRFLMRVSRDGHPKILAESKQDVHECDPQNHAVNQH